MIAAALAVAPNGGRRTKADHPGVPMNAAELARDAAGAAEAGACMIHFHARDARGRHTLDADANVEAIRAIRAAAGERLIVQMTTEAVGFYRPAEQMAAVRAVRPEACSLALRELLPAAEDEPVFADFLGWLGSERIAPQFILYSADDAARLADLRRRGVIPGAGLAVLYVLGRYVADQRSRPADLLPLLGTEIPDLVDWMVCAFGPDEAACALASVALGGGARLGFENNLQLADGRTAANNAALIEQAAKALGGIGRSAMKVQDYREKLGRLF